MNNSIDNTAALINNLSFNDNMNTTHNNHNNNVGSIGSATSTVVPPSTVLLKIFNIPNDITISDAFAIFALSEGLINLDIITKITNKKIINDTSDDSDSSIDDNNNNVSSNIIIAKFNSLDLARYYSTLLISNDKIFNNNNKIYIHLEDEIGNILNIYNKSDNKFINTTHIPTFSYQNNIKPYTNTTLPQLSPTTSTSSNHLYQLKQQQQNNTFNSNTSRFSFNDPFSNDTNSLYPSLAPNNIPIQYNNTSIQPSILTIPTDTQIIKNTSISTPTVSIPNNNATSSTDTTPQQLHGKSFLLMSENNNTEMNDILWNLPINQAPSNTTLNSNINQIPSNTTNTFIYSKPYSSTMSNTSQSQMSQPLSSSSSSIRNIYNQNHSNSISHADLLLLSKVPPPSNPADQNPPCNTLYVGNLPIDATEQELRKLFSNQQGFKRLSFRTKNNNSNSNPNMNHGPMCFVEFDDISYATRALAELYGSQLPSDNLLNGSSNNNKGGIRLSFSKNPLGVRGPKKNLPNNNNNVNMSQNNFTHNHNNNYNNIFN